MKHFNINETLILENKNLDDIIMFQRTLNGADMINATSINLPPNENAIRINGDFGTAGQVIAKDTNNKLNWSRVDEVEIPDGSIGGEKLKPDIDIDTTGDIEATNITATNILKTETTLDLPNTTSAINITDGGGVGLAGQALVKNNLTNKLEWDYVDDITIEDRTIEGIKLVKNTITKEEIATGAVTTDEIFDGTIENIDIKDGTIQNGKLKNLTIENGKIKNETIEGGKLATDIVIDTTGTITADDITGEVIMAKDHFIQTTENGSVENTFTGKLTTIDDVQGVDVISTNKFSQTGTEKNTFGGGIEISSGAFTQTSGADNSFGGAINLTSGATSTFAGPLHLTKAGNATAPVQYIDGGFALQVGTDAINSDVYISRNLVVDGLIKGDLSGDVSDIHIQTQSLLVHDLTDPGLEGIEVRDDYDIRLYDNQAGDENLRIELKSSTGEISLKDGGEVETINLNGTNGDITAKFGDFIIDSQYGEFKGFDNSGTKSQIKDVDFSSNTLVDVVENRVGRTFTKRWMPVKNGSGKQVSWTYSASIVPSQNWHDFSGEYNAAGTMTPRHLLDITNVKIRTTKVRARISINMACNYQFGIRLSWRTGQGTIGNPYTDWSTEEAYLAFGDDWIEEDGDKEGFLGQGQWKWDFPVMTTVQNVYYSFMPEVFIMYNMEIGSPTSAVQFWVGSSTGNDAPSEDNECDMPAIFEVIEIPATLFQESTAAGTYPSSEDDY